MCDLLSRFCTLRCACFAYIFLSAACQDAIADKETIQKVRNDYHHSISMVQRVSTRSKVVWDYKVDLSKHGLHDGDTRKVDWAIHGAKFLFHDADPRGPVWFSSDGVTTWTLHYKKDPTKLLLQCASTEKLKTKTDGLLRRSMTPGRWLGMYVSMGEDVQSGETVLHMLEKPSSTFVGYEDLDGVPTAHLSLVYSRVNAKSGKKEVPVDIWFDLDHGSLPKKIAIDTAGGQVLTVNEFTTRDSVHFPTRMELSEKILAAHVEVEDFQIGSKVEASMFAPALPDGTPTFATDDKKGFVAMSNYLAGISSDQVAAKAEEIKRQAKRQPAGQLAAMPTAVTPAVSTDGRFDPAKILWIVGWSVFILSGVWWFRNSRQSS